MPHEPAPPEPATRILDRVNEVKKIISAYPNRRGCEAHVAALLHEGIPAEPIRRALRSAVEGDDVVHAALAAHALGVATDHLDAAARAGASGPLLGPASEAIMYGASARAAKAVLKHRTFRRRGVPMLPPEELSNAILLVHEKKADVGEILGLVRHGFGGQRLAPALDAVHLLPRSMAWQPKMALIRQASQFIEEHAGVVPVEAMPHVALSLTHARDNFILRAFEAHTPKEKVPLASASIQNVNGASVIEVRRMNAVLAEYEKNHGEPYAEGGNGAAHAGPTGILDAIKHNIPESTVAALMEARAPAHELTHYGTIRKLAQGELDGDTSLALTKRIASLEKRHHLDAYELPRLVRAVALNPEMGEPEVSEAINALEESDQPFSMLPGAVKAASEYGLDGTGLATALQCTPKGKTIRHETALTINAVRASNLDVEKTNGHRLLALATQAATGRAAAWAYAALKLHGEQRGLKEAQLLAGHAGGDLPYVSAAINILNTDAAALGDPPLCDQWLEAALEMKEVAKRHDIHGEALTYFYALGHLLVPPPGRQGQRRKTSELEAIWTIKLRKPGNHGPDFKYEVNALKKYGGVRGKPGLDAFLDGLRGEHLIREAADREFGADLSEAYKKMLERRRGTRLSDEERDKKTQSAYEKRETLLSLSRDQVRAVTEYINHAVNAMAPVLNAPFDEFEKRSKAREEEERRKGRRR